MYADMNGMSCKERIGQTQLANLYRKWAKVKTHNFRILAFKTEWKYYYWMRKY